MRAFEDISIRELIPQRPPFVVIDKLLSFDMVFTVTKIGVIGTVNNFEVFRTPKIGEVIITTIEMLEEMFQVTMVKAVVKCGEETMAQANMKIAIIDQDAQD